MAGLGIVYKNNEIMVGVMNSTNVVRNDFMSVSKTCKLHADSKDQYSISIKLTNKTLISVYIRDKDLRDETLCASFPLPGPLEDFYFSSSAIDLGGECSSEIREAIFKPSTLVEIIDDQNKE